MIAARLLAEPRRPAWVRERPNAPYYALAAVCVGAFMGQLDASIVTVALPTLQRTYHASVSAVTWVGLTYLLVLIAAVAVAGRLGDRYGRKLVYTYGFLVFVAGSALCAAAPSLMGLDGFRALQAVGAAMLQANSVAIVYLALPPDRLGRGLGLQGAAQAIGLALGPSIGGALLAAGGWRMIFLVNVPAGLVGAVAAAALVPRSRPHRLPTAGGTAPARRRWRALAPSWCSITQSPAAGDAAGGAGHGAPAGSRWRALAPSGCSITQSPAPGDAGAGATGTAPARRRWRALASSGCNITQSPAPPDVAGHGAGHGAPAGSRRQGTRSRAPAARRRSPWSTPVTASLAASLLSYVLLFGTMFVVPFFLERSRGLSAGRAGLLLTALPLALGLAAPFAGRLAERGHGQVLTVAGPLLAGLSLAAAAVLRPGLLVLALLLAVAGAGVGMFTPANNALVMRAAAPGRAGVASGVLNRTRAIGTAAGLAVTGWVFGTFSGHAASPAATGHGFAAAALALAAVGAAAAWFARAQSAAGART